MATWTWGNGTIGSWFTTSNWTVAPPTDPSPFPQPGDGVIVNSGTAMVDASQGGTLDMEAISLGGTASVNPAVILLASVTLGSNLSITSGAGSQYGGLEISGTSTNQGTLSADAAGRQFTITIDNPGTVETLTNTGTIVASNGDTILLQAGLEGALINTGSVIVNAGTFVVGANASFVNASTIAVSNGGDFAVQTTGAIQGTGTISISTHGTVEIGSVPPSLLGPGFPYAQTVSFLDATGTLDLTDPTGFAGLITGFQIGDVIDLLDTPTNWASYNNGRLALGAAGADGKASLLRLDILPPGTTVGVRSDGNGGTLIEIAPLRTWTGSASNDFYDPANWSTSSGFSNAAPGPGDVAVLRDANAVISSTDPAELVDVQISMGSTIVSTLTLAAGETVGGGSSITSNGTTGSQSEITLLGSTILNGAITASGVDNSLILQLGSSGSSVDLTIANPEATFSGGATTSAVIDASSESRITIVGNGTITNDALMQSAGGLTISSAISLAGTGTIQLLGGGYVELDGAVGPGQTVQFNEGGEKLVVGDSATFQGVIENILASDTIDIVGQTGTVHYDTTTETLTLLQGATVEATLRLSGNYDPALFQQSSDGNGGTNITYAQTPNLTDTLVSLPVAAIGTVGADISLTQLLTEAFGAVPDVVLQYGCKISYRTAAQLAQVNLSYWEPADPSVSSWIVNGVDTGGTVTTIAPSDLSSVMLQLGNNIEPQAFIDIPIATNNGTASAWVDYEIATVNSSVAQVTGTSVPAPGDILQAATAFSIAYVNVPNNNDCPNISADVGAAAGAVHPAYDASTDPDQNVGGGFWRIVYRGTQSNPVQDWYTEIEPGDFVRMGWSNGGQHTTTIIGSVLPDGTVTVYDNDATLPSGIGGIGIHNDEYWPKTNPSSITIYRLDPSGQYLIYGTSTSPEIIQGSVYNDLIEPLGGNDTITGGPGQDEVQGTSAILNGDKITDWHIGDVLDFTDIPDPQSIKTNYDPNTGILTVQAGDISAVLTLTVGQTGTFEATSDTSGGSLVTEVACFAAGTLISTPSGERLVQQLAVGDLVMTLSGAARPIAWIGVGKVLATRGRRSAATPVIVRKGALADNVPHHDLHVTKGHSLFVDDVLIPVEYLINHRSIAWDDRAQEVAIFHIELETHDVLLANGAPAESYRDDGNRWLFRNANSGWNLPPQAPRAPVLTGGPLVDAVWRRLLERVGPRKLPPLTDDPDLHLLMDGVRLDAAWQTDELHIFRLPAIPLDLRIISRAAVPAELGLARDPRPLGVALRRIAVRQGTRFATIQPDDPRLQQGFHAFEADSAMSWTDGDAVIPVAAFAGFAGPVEVLLHVAATARYLEEGDTRRAA